MKGLHVPSKLERVYRFHHETVHHFVELLGALGVDHPRELQRRDVNRRLTDGVVKTYEELHPSLESGILVRPWKEMPSFWKEPLTAAQAESFQAFRAGRSEPRSA